MLLKIVYFLSMLIINQNTTCSGKKLTITLWGSINPKKKISSNGLCNQDIKIKGDSSELEPTTIAEEAKKYNNKLIDSVFNRNNFEGITDIRIITFRGSKAVTLNGSVEFIAGKILEHIPKGVNVEVKIPEISKITGEKYVATGGKYAIKKILQAQK